MNGTKALIKPHIDLNRISIYREAVDLFMLSRKLLKTNELFNSIKCPLEKNTVMAIQESITSYSLQIPITIAEATATEDAYKKLYAKKHILHRLIELTKLYSKLETYTLNIDTELNELAIKTKTLQQRVKKWPVHLILQN